MAAINKDSHIIIVGAGVFGLSNALHLAQNGYKNITVFDRLDFNKNHYTFLEGADTASADLNKIFRAQYADKKYYQDLAFEAFDVWQKWDREIQLLPEHEAKKYTDLKILDLCGMLRLDDVVSGESKQSKMNFEKEGLLPLIYDINDKADVKRANAAGLGSKVKYAHDIQQKIPSMVGVLDTTSGMLYASRACQYAKYLCEQMGVKFVVGGDKGSFEKFIYKDSAKSDIGGIVTKDGVSHFADLVVVNCGPWTTSLVPELDGINEGTAGNILHFKIPEHRKDLRVKYSSKNFPLVGWKTGHDREKNYLAGMFMFPATEPEGIMKVIVRQTKYTNPVEKDGKIISIPKTSNSSPPFQNLTKNIVYQAREWLKQFFPDLVSAGIEMDSKILWYTDTINNDYIYDFVPEKKGLFVACGGSGHAFKMLPVLGQFLVDKIEGRENIYTEKFKWRYQEDFEKDPNGLKEKLESKRRYDVQDIASREDLKFHAGPEISSKL